MGFKTDLPQQSPYRDLQAALDRLIANLQVDLLDPHTGPLESLTQRIEARCHLRIRAAFHLGRTDPSTVKPWSHALTNLAGMLNVVVFGGVDELRQLRAATEAA